MKKIFLILFLFYSSATLSNTSIKDSATNIKIENLNDDLQIAGSFGALKNLFKGAGRGSKLIKKPGSKNMLKTGDDFFSSKPYTKIQKSSFDWGFNPNPAAISKNLKEMREFDPEEYDELSTWDCPNHIKNSSFMKELSEEQRRRLNTGITALKPRAKTLTQLAENSFFYIAPRPIKIEEKAGKLLNENNRAHLLDIASELTRISDWTAKNLESTIRDFAKSRTLKLGQIAQPLRASLTGALTSPGIFEVMETLGRIETIARLRDL